MTSVPRDSRAGPSRLARVVIELWALLGGGVLCAVVLINVYSTVMGALFSAPFPGDFEMTEVGIAVAVFAFLPYCQITGANVTADIFTARASARTVAVLKFAADIEEVSSVFYKDAAEKSGRADLFTDFAREGEKLLKTVERTRRELVNEMMLEPIEGLYAELPNLAVPAGPGQVLKKAVELETDAVAFYTDAGSAVKSFASPVSRAFKRIAEQRAKRKEKLEAL